MGKTKVDSEMLSAVFDGEGTSEEVEAVLDELENDFDFRETWKRYSMIGAAIRKSDRGCCGDRHGRAADACSRKPFDAASANASFFPHRLYSSPSPIYLPSFICLLSCNDLQIPASRQDWCIARWSGCDRVCGGHPDDARCYMELDDTRKKHWRLEGVAEGILASDESVENDTASGGGLVSVRTASFSDSIGTSADLTRQRADQYMQRHVQSVSMKNRSPIPFAKAVAHSRDSNASVSP